jgi:hypothetical protein
LYYPDNEAYRRFIDSLTKTECNGSGSQEVSKGSVNNSHRMEGGGMQVEDDCQRMQGRPVSAFFCRVHLIFLSSLYMVYMNLIWSFSGHYWRILIGPDIERAGERNCGKMNFS